TSRLGCGRAGAGTGSSHRRADSCAWGCRWASGGHGTRPGEWAPPAGRIAGPCTHGVSDAPPGGATSRDDDPVAWWELATTQRSHDLRRVGRKGAREGHAMLTQDGAVVRGVSHEEHDPID